MEQLKSIKECLTAQVQSQMGNLYNVDTKELGEAIDMIKDLSEAIYYCTITEAMDEKYSLNPQSEKYYSSDYYYPNYYRDMDKAYGKMYYSNSSSNFGQTSMENNSGSTKHYSESDYPIMNTRDIREGKSPMSRKTYIESKESHMDKAVQMKELENYMQELSQDLTDMIKDATPEEKQLLQRKIAALATKIA